jgi:hypothetical protein
MSYTIKELLQREVEKSYNEDFDSSTVNLFHAYALSLAFQNKLEHATAVGLNKVFREYIKHRDGVKSIDMMGKIRNTTETFFPSINETLISLKDAQPRVIQDDKTPDYPDVILVEEY